MSSQEYNAFVRANVEKLTGFKDALLGVALIDHRWISVYSYERCLEILITRDNATRDEATEWMQYNVMGACAGRGTRVVFVMTFDED